MEPDPELPYMVYARDFGACLAEGVSSAASRNRPGRAKIRYMNASSGSWACRSSARSPKARLKAATGFDEATVVHGVVARTTWEGVQCLRDP